MTPEKQDAVDPFEQFQPGDYVKHPKFGNGQILQKIGTFDDTKLVVSFSEEGEKKLMASYAKLKKIRPIAAAVEEAPTEEETKPDAEAKSKKPANK